MKDKPPKAPPIKESAEPTPLEKMADLTRRVVRVPKDDAVKPKRNGPKRRH